MSDQNTIKNGGPAFPCDDLVDQSGNVHRTAGMTLRDYLAARAMTSIIDGAFRFGAHKLIDAEVAKQSYAMADAMLKAREVQP